MAAGAAERFEKLVTLLLPAGESASLAAKEFVKTGVGRGQRPLKLSNRILDVVTPDLVTIDLLESLDI
jgi:hypothetical protein